MQVGNVSFLPQSFHVGSVSIVSLSSHRLDQSIKNPTFDHGTNGYVFKGGNTPKMGISKGKNDEASNVGGVPNMFIQPSRSSRTNKKQHLKCSAKLSHQSRSCGDVSPCFHHIFENKNIHTQSVFFLHGFDHILKVFKVIPIYKPYKSHISHSV